MMATERAPRYRTTPVGFIGLGVMGRPMATNLAWAGNTLRAWNRSNGDNAALLAAGATIAGSVEQVFADSQIVIIMLANAAALDAVLRRGTPAFATLVRDHLIVSMGSNAPGYSMALAAEIGAAGGAYVEAPVSGSRQPAEQAQLVALVSGSEADIEAVRPLLLAMCRACVHCGPVGNALLTKLAVNLYLNTMLAGLAEAVHFANAHGLPLEVFKQAIDLGPMASDVTRVKLPKFLARDFSVQAATEDAYNSTCLIAAAARAVGVASPLLDLASSLYADSVQRGNARLDMISVLEAIEAITQEGKSSAQASAAAGK